MTSINTLLANNRRNSAYGAPRGDRGYINEDQPLTGLRCERLRMVDGDYGPDGTYWGYSPSNGYMYVVFNGATPEFKTACGLLKYYRAKSRADAIAQFNDDSEGYTFARGTK